ncbi:hypothetical protein AAKU67_003171 [Oxalobacteraceae bacterium GrIS 2.11]
MSLFPHVALVLTLVFCLPAQAEDELDVTPYRPTVSNPAQLPAPGQLEFEFGGLDSKTGDLTRGSLPYLFKLAFDEQWGVLLGGEGYVRNAGGGATDTGIGDTNLTLKRAFLINSATAFGLEFNVKLPTAKDTIGSGKTDYGINGIFSRDFDEIHMDTNLNVTHIGTDDASSGNLQTGLSTSLSHMVTEKWGVSAELSGTRRTSVPSTAQFLVAATYSPSKHMTLDIGLLRGLNAASPDWAIFSGIVIPVAKLW